MSGLSERELKFCQAFVACGNATESYLYCSNGTITRESASTQGYELLRKVEVDEKIRELKNIEQCKQQILIAETQRESLKAVSLLLEIANKIGTAINKKLPDPSEPNFEEKIKKIRASELKTLASAMSDCCNIFREIRVLQLEFSGLTYIVDNADKLVKKEGLN